MNYYVCLIRDKQIIWQSNAKTKENAEILRNSLAFGSAEIGLSVGIVEYQPVDTWVRPITDIVKQRKTEQDKCSVVLDSEKIAAVIDDRILNGLK